MATQTGTSGSDVFVGTSGSDKYIGSAGDDTFYYSIFANLGSADFYNGSGGTDTLVFSATVNQASALASAIAAYNAHPNGIFSFQTYDSAVQLNIVNIEKIV